MRFNFEINTHEFFDICQMKKLTFSLKFLMEYLISLAGMKTEFPKLFISLNF